MAVLMVAGVGPGTVSADSQQTVVTAEVVPTVSLTNQCQAASALDLDLSYVGQTAQAVSATDGSACRFSFSGSSETTISLRQRDGAGTALVAETGGATGSLVGEANPMRGASLVDASTGVVVGYDGRIFRMTDGVNWVQESLPVGHTTANLFAVDMATATVGWAVGPTGSIYKRTAGGWVNQASPTAEDLQAVAVVSTTVAYAVGNNGTILRTLDGNNWVQLPAPGGVPRDYYAVEATDVDEVIIAGAASALSRSSNADAVPAANVAWQNPSNGVPGSARIRSISAQSFGSMWLATTGRTFYSSNFGGVGGWEVRGRVISGNEVVASSGSAATIVGDGAQIRETADAGTSWTNLESPTVGRVMAIDRIGNTLIAAGDVRGAWHSTDGGGNWSEITSVRPALSGVAAAGRDHAWFVGADGTIRHTVDGTSTSAQASGVTENLRDVEWLGTSLAGTGDVLIAVGDDGTILRTENGGGTWDDVSPGVGEDLYQVGSADGQLVYAVGESGRILSSANGGSTWRTRSSGTAQDLWRVTVGNSPGHAWASGEEATIVRTTDGGESWADVSLPANEEYALGLYAVDDSQVVLGVASGTYYRSVDGGTNWALAVDVGNDQIFAIDGLGTGMVVGAAVFDNSGRLSWDGFQNSTQIPAQDPYPMDLALFDGYGAYQVTQRGGVQRYTFATPIDDYAAGDWAADEEHFGACLQGVGAQTVPIWGVQSGGNPAACEPIDGDGWHGIPTTWDAVASTAAGDPGEVTLVWGMQATASTLAGNYRAAIIVEALAANV